MMFRFWRSARWRVALCLLLSLAPGVDRLAAAAPAGDQLFVSSGCRGCHLWQGRGGKLGPALDGATARLDRHQLVRLLRQPRQHNPTGRMPSYDHLGDTELQQLVDYLLAPR